MKKQKGFSLIELLIVVGIIGALTAIAVPAYSQYKRQSDVAAAVASVKALLTKAEQHLADGTITSGNETVNRTLITFLTSADTEGGLGVTTAADGFPVGDLGVITATEDTLIFTLGSKVSFPDQTITYSRSDVVWTCAMSAGITGIDVKGCNATEG
ncbi:prepilin-type N-terminal cleavage/methylation domain-containing protein [Enterovibrio baiacu]|uniref:prepilin-type N-terminal cleavage/methylation domain-containing protein n=1 Tax=Enterovibrio baiacu TaxID=2491023 RepID=UPI0010115840|nr:prepilin-type N-terminal cleavage/methylation domain-containing protein [Enterovibrio baiacu]MBE1276204.1 prepilin-type N-terminal cleavage/methylation domain-containing protein [Enterovibrio baiacu]